MCKFSNSPVATVKRFDDRNAPNKVDIEDHFYKIAGRYYKGNANIVSGPNFDRHVRNAFEHIARTPKSQVYLIENDPYIADLLRKKRKAALDSGDIRVRKYKRVHIVERDAASINVQRFEDMDLMGTWDGRADEEYSPMEVFSSTLYTQAMKLPRSLNKIFIGTVALRNSGGKRGSVRRINRLLGIIGARIGGFDQCSGSYGRGKMCFHPSFLCDYVFEHEANFERKGRVKRLEMFAYSDGTPMLTFMIVFK